MHIIHSIPDLIWQNKVQGTCAHWLESYCVLCYHLYDMQPCLLVPVLPRLRRSWAPQILGSVILGSVELCSVEPGLHGACAPWSLCSVEPGLHGSQGSADPQGSTDPQTLQIHRLQDPQLHNSTILHKNNYVNRKHPTLMNANSKMSIPSITNNNIKIWMGIFFFLRDYPKTRAEGVIS